jgi:sugar phosphate isomerase/epimerase
MSQFPRRHFLITGTAAAAALAIESTRPSLLCAEAPGRALGIQLYTVAADLAKDVPGTLKALSNIGYKNVESAGFANLSAADFRKAIDDAGFRCPSAHLRLTADDPGPLFDEAHALGAHYAVSSVLVATSEQAPQPGVGQKEAAQGFVKNLSNLTLDDFKRTAELANRIGVKAKAAGLQYAYHNHNFEFKDQGNGQVGYDVLLSQTDPDLVKFELDCGWMVAAGHDPVQYFSKYPNRYRMIHVKDFVAGSKPTTNLTGPERPTGTELGRGHIDYAPIFAAAGAAGVEYFFSEQEPPIVGMTALEAAKVNFDYMRAIK